MRTKCASALLLVISHSKNRLFPLEIPKLITQNIWLSG